jgi:hypothetical protein
VASERAFSSASLTDEIHHNRMDAKAFGYVQILKYAYKTNFLNAMDEAAAHEPFTVVQLE